MAFLAELAYAAARDIILIQQFGGHPQTSALVQAISLPAAGRYAAIRQDVEADTITTHFGDAQ